MLMHSKIVKTVNCGMIVLMNTIKLTKNNMTIFKIRSKDFVKGKLVGVEIPQQLHSYLALFTLAKGVTKSAVLRNLIQKWYENIPTSEDELIEILMYEFRIQFQVRKTIVP